MITDRKLRLIIWDQTLIAFEESWDQVLRMDIFKQNNFEIGCALCFYRLILPTIYVFMCSYVKPVRIATCCPAMAILIEHMRFFSEWTSLLKLFRKKGLKFKRLFLATGGVLWKLRHQLQTNVVPGP